MRAAQLYNEGDRTHFGQLLEKCHIRACWDKAMTNAGGIEARAADVAGFNAGSRWRKRGLAAVPTKFGISFTTKFLNQVGGEPLTDSGFESSLCA